MLHRALTVAAITGGLAAPSIAAACQSTGPLLGTHLQAPHGCPIYVFVGGPGQPPFAPRLTALRNGAYVDVTDQNASSQTIRYILVETTISDCEQRMSKSTTNELFVQYTLVPQADVQVGERIGIDEGWFEGLEILPPGSCTPVEVPMISCTQDLQCPDPGFPIDDIDSGGCAAGAGGRAALPSVLLALLSARRRRRRTIL